MHRSAAVATVTLNPAIDQTVFIPGFRPSHVNRVAASRSQAGGKGVNVASFLADARVPVAVTGFLGADNPQLFEDLCVQKSIEDLFVRISGMTRTGIKILDELAGQTTDINFPGLPPGPEHIAELIEVVEKLAKHHAWVVFSGSIPPGVPADIYAQLVRVAKSAGALVVLDTSGASLKHAVDALPEVMKPNVRELEELLDQPLRTRQDVVNGACQLLDLGIGTVVVSMGPEGAIFAESGEVIWAEPPTVEVKSTVGAGDAMVAGIVAGKLAGDTLADLARRGTAFSQAAVTRVETNLPGEDVIDRFADQVRIRRLR